MKQFFGAFFGSIIGIIVAAALAILLLVVAVKSSINEAFKDEEAGNSIVKSNSVLKLTLDGRITERSKENPLEDLLPAGPFSESSSNGLNDLTEKIKKAKGDAKVSGIFLCFKNFQTGFATLEELRNALLDFKSSGKFIYSYAEAYDQKDYYLASSANKIFLNPQGALEWKGLSTTLMFFKHSFEKLDLDVQIFRHGKFKSAIEPFMLDKMSEANRMQAETFLSSMWNQMTTGIAKERNLKVEDLNAMANNLSLRSPEDALKGMVDQLSYEDEVVSAIKKKVGVAEKDKFKFVDFNKYEAKNSVALKSGRIAVIYANGSIGEGEGSDDEIGSDRLARTIREARLDDKIKAIVLRVNSPGGSALASDVIWREMALARKEKPTVVSMGDLAASGGYYISCAAERIFAQPNTLTGSIGVFGVIPNFKKMLESKLGITLDTVNTNKYSDMGALRPLSATESNFIQVSIEKVYGTFISRVADGRNLSLLQVDSIGQGRVWAGSDALKIGLVDELGGLNDAIAYAAKKAKIKEYRIQEMPKQISPFDGLLGKKEAEFESRLLQHKLGPLYNYFTQIQELSKMKGIQARLPYLIEIN
jgi:protease-4